VLDKEDEGVVEELDEGGVELDELDEGGVELDEGLVEVLDELDEVDELDEGLVVVNVCEGSLFGGEIIKLLLDNEA
jgi:hypothetical protein